MAKIVEVYYEETDANVRESGEFYYYFNLIGMSESFNAKYEQHESDQIAIRNKTVAAAMDREELPNRLKIQHSILAISSLKNKIALIAEYQ